jgi:hypothetical protein
MGTQTPDAGIVRTLPQRAAWSWDSPSRSPVSDLNTNWIRNKFAVLGGSGSSPNGGAWFSETNSLSLFGAYTSTPIYTSSDPFGTSVQSGVVTAYWYQGGAQSGPGLPPGDSVLPSFELPRLGLSQQTAPPLSYTSRAFIQFAGFSLGSQSPSADWRHFNFAEDFSRPGMRFDKTSLDGKATINISAPTFAPGSTPTPIGFKLTPDTPDPPFPLSWGTGIGRTADTGFDQPARQCNAPCQLTVPANQFSDYGIKADYKLSYGLGNDLGKKFTYDIDFKPHAYTSAYWRSDAPSSAAPVSANNLFPGLHPGDGVTTSGFAIGANNYTVALFDSPNLTNEINWWMDIRGVWQLPGGYLPLNNECRGKLPAAYVEGEPFPATALGHDLPEATVRLAIKHRGHR